MDRFWHIVYRQHYFKQRLHLRNKSFPKIKDISDRIKVINVGKSSIAYTWKRILKSDISLNIKGNLRLTLLRHNVLKLTNNDVYLIF